jgi:Holliday junction resolvase-like predicted endonuclease
VARDELDLVMLAPDRQTVVVVEVKSSASGLAAASALLDRRKRTRIARALRMLESLGVLGGMPVRLDAIFVSGSGSKPGLKHHQGRTLPPRGS